LALEELEQLERAVRLHSVLIARLQVALRLAALAALVLAEILIIPAVLVLEV
jgi:hypothetical protein